MEGLGAGRGAVLRGGVGLRLWGWVGLRRGFILGVGGVDRVNGQGSPVGAGRVRR